MNKYLILFLVLFCCASKKEENKAVTVITITTKIDSLLNVISKKSDFAEAQLWYRFIDTLAVDQPAIINKARQLRAAWMDSTIKKYLRDNNMMGRLARWVVRDSLKTLEKLRTMRRLGQIVYYSFLDTSIVVEQYRYNRITKRKAALGRLYAARGSEFIGYKFDNPTQMQNQLQLRRAKYDTTVFK